MLVVAILVGGGWWLLNAPQFAVERVESGAYRFTSREQLQQVLSVFLGRNIWRVSSGEVTDAMTELPWVRDLRVIRRLPATIEVDFREWRPLLVVAPVDGGGQRAEEPPQVLVADGRVLPFPDHLALAGLPVLVGVSWAGGNDSGDRRLDVQHAGAVLDLVSAMEDTGLESVSPVDFLIAKAEGFTIVLQAGGGNLLVGREEFASRLNRYMAARQHLARGLDVDLRFADRITCKPAASGGP